MSLLDWYAPPAKFPTMGTVVAGEVISDGKEIQDREFNPDGGAGKPKFYEDGKPVMVYVVTVATTPGDPDGDRSIYFRGQMLGELRNATRAARVREVATGGKLAVKFVREEPLPPGRRGHPQKIYAVKYTPPVAGMSQDEPPRTLRQAEERAAARQQQAGPTDDPWAGTPDEPPF